MEKNKLSSKDETVVFETGFQNINASGISPKALVVLQAARKVFLTYGFSAATTDMIQRESNVSKSTIYTYFKNKESLFIAVVESECTTLIQRIRSIKFRRLQLREGLITVALAYLDIILSESGLSLYRMVISEAPRFPCLAAKFYETGPAAVAHVVAQKLEDTQASGEITLAGLSPETAANIFMHLVRSEPHLYSLTHPEEVCTQAQRSAWVENIVDTFVECWTR